MRAIFLAIWLAGCSGDDAAAPALAAYDAGQLALERGDSAGAAAFFSEARVADPGSAALCEWHAHALAEAGDVPGALTVYADGLARFPDAEGLRYNRAALRARSGDAAGAATDLQILYNRGMLDPGETGADPDFAALSADPQYAALAPPPKVRVAVNAEAGAVLLGEEQTLEFTVEAPVGAVLALRDLGSPTGLLRLTDVVEAVHAPVGRVQAHQLRLVWKAVAVGEARAGPWEVEAGAVRGTSESMAVGVVALGAAQTTLSPLEPSQVPMPGSWLSGEVGEVTRRGRFAVLRLADGARVATTPPGIAAVRLETRRDGVTVARGRAYPLGSGGRVQVTMNGETTLDAALP